MTVLRNDVKMAPFKKSCIPHHFEHDEVGTMTLYRKTDLRHTYWRKSGEALCLKPCREIRQASGPPPQSQSPSTDPEGRGTLPYPSLRPPIRTVNGGLEEVAQPPIL